MALPNLLHPVPITIQRMDASETIVDPAFRETVQQAIRHPDVIVQGQVKWGQDRSLFASKGGPTEDSDGYVLFRYFDLTLLSIEINRGDRFTKLGRIETDVYVVKLEPMGHWGDQGGATLVRAYFKDRQPGRQNRGAL